MYVCIATATIILLIFYLTIKHQSVTLGNGN